LQSALVEQIIPQLVQATGGQVAALQYIFKDEQQPLSAQFIQDSQALVANDENHQIGMKNNLTAQGQVLSGHNSWLGQSMNTGGYKINDDLVTKTGEFTKPTTYQRLY
ncbi:MAG: McrB family protein, partial [Psychrobacter sp.]